jgi:MFS family permease
MARRSQRTGTLAASAAIGSVGLAAGGSASPLLAATMTEGVAAAGLPLGVVVAGSALSALLISWGTARAGRVSSLCIGYAAGALGALIVVTGAHVESFAIVLAGSLLLGAGNAAVFLTRYAAAELAAPGARGRAVGSVLLATTAGAVIAPNLLVPSARVARALDLPALSGLFLLAAPAFAAAALLLARSSDADTRVGRTTSVSFEWGPQTRTALAVLATANLVMVAIMAIAPVHMIEDGHGLAFVGLVVSVHVAAMFAPSSLNGRLADHTGPLTVCAGGLLLLLATAAVGGIAAFSSDAAVLVFLIAVGLGWNAAVIGGSTLLVASVPNELRPRTEGVGELAMGLAAAAGAPGAGLVVALGGVLALGLASALVVTAGLGVIALVACSPAIAPNPRATRRTQV